MAWGSYALALLAIWAAWRFLAVAFDKTHGVAGRVIGGIFGPVIAFVVVAITIETIVMTPEKRAERERQIAHADAQKAKAVAQEQRAELAAKIEQAKPMPLARAEFAEYQVVDVDHRGSRVHVRATKTDFITSGWLRSQALFDVSAYLEKVFSGNPELTNVEFVLLSKLVDLRGNESIEPIMRIVFTKENSAKMNWRNFNASNLPRVADEYWEHPSFERD